MQERARLLSEVYMDREQCKVMKSMGILMFMGVLITDVQSCQKRKLRQIVTKGYKFGRIHKTEILGNELSIWQ